MVSISIDRQSPATTPSPRIVALGASAGGLEPLAQFFANVPAGSGMAYVVVQHMDPTHKPMLSDLLQRSTSMRVHEASESLRLEADTVYVIPPNAELTVAGGTLHLADPTKPRGMRLPIDILFNSPRETRETRRLASCCRAWDRTARWVSMRSRHRAA